MQRRTGLLILIACALISAHLSSGVASSFFGPGDVVTNDLVLHTVDGVKIKGTLYSRNNNKILIYCHRLLAGKDGKEVQLLKTRFLDDYDLLVYDSRGHKASFGSSTCGGDEILDLHAVLSFCKHRRYSKIAVLGAGMGGAVGARTARIFRNIDALVVVSPSSFSPIVSPFLVRVLSDRTFDTLFGRVPLRVITDTRLGSRYTAGFPGDDTLSTTSVPSLVLQAERDPFVDLGRLQTLLGPLDTYGRLLTVAGKKHAEGLLTESALEVIREFLDRTLDAPEARPTDRESASPSPAAGEVQNAVAAIAFDGDLPLPRHQILQDLRDQSAVGPGILPREPLGYEESVRKIQDILHFHGYTRAVATGVTGPDASGIRIRCPKIHAVEVSGNRWLADAHMHRVLHLGRDYFNAYELDTALRRLSSEPAIKSCRYSISEREDGDLDIEIEIKEHRILGFVLSTRFTDIDDFVGLGVNWQEFNPDAIRYEGSVMLGISDRDLLHSHSLRKNLLSRDLTLQATYFDIIKSRDDLAYVFSRQEVREVGTEITCRYQISSNFSVRLGAFGKDYESPEVTAGLPVSEGRSRGISTTLDLSGSYPPQRKPRLRWGHTFYYQRAGLAEEGDFDFETYQFNVSTLFQLTEDHDLTGTFHGGWVTKGAPPQEQLSLGGMTSLPGYPDDSFVNRRMILTGTALRLAASSLVDETSVWFPMRLILSAHTGATWARDEQLRLKDLRSDVGLEVDYMKTLRLGIAWPVGNQHEETGRLYIGWGPHVY